MAAHATPAYTATARILHWIMAVLIIGLIPGGVIMGNLPSGPTQDMMYNMHRSLGVVVGVLVLVRIAYRLTHPPRPLGDEVEPLQKLAASAVHGLLYVTMVLQPLFGWIATSAFGAPISVFNLFTLPPIVGRDEATAKLFFLAHELTGFAMAGLIALHVGAALFHHFVKRDMVLRRMLGA